MDLRSSIKPTEVSHTFEWTVNNVTTVKERLISPRVRVGKHAKWYLELCPTNVTKSGTEYVGVELRYDSTQRVCAKCELAFINNNDENVLTVKSVAVQSDSGHNFAKIKLRRSDLFNPNNKLLKENRLTVYCKIKLVVDRSDFERDFSDDLTPFFDPQFTDFVFAVGLKEFNVHKTLFAAKSDVFKAMFTATGMQESEQNKAIITDIDEEVFQEMVRFMYTGMCSNNACKIVYKLLAAADKYDISDLKTFCEDILNSSLSAETAAYVLMVYDCHNSNLKGEAVNYIVDNFDGVKRSQSWKELSAEKPQLAIDVLERMADKYKLVERRYDILKSKVINTPQMSVK